MNKELNKQYFIGVTVFFFYFVVGQSGGFFECSIYDIIVHSMSERRK